MRLTKTQGKRAEKTLNDGGYTKADVARLARVSYRMAKYWYDGEKSSPKCAGAHRKLTGLDPTSTETRAAAGAA